jgi:acyl dehydratase
MTQHFEDLETGGTIEAAGYRVSAEEIIGLAERYDPRPFHLDAGAGEQSVFGGLVASGIHSIAIWNRLRFDAEAGLAMLAGLGLDELRYHRPVRPGDCLSLRAECVEKRYSQNDANRGIMRFRHRLVNQDGDAVMTCIVTLLVAARGPATEP